LTPTVALAMCGDLAFVALGVFLMPPVVRIPGISVLRLGGAGSVPIWTTTESPSDLSADFEIAVDGAAELTDVHVLRRALRQKRIGSSGSQKRRLASG
jgi:hypothetical protein